MFETIKQELLGLEKFILRIIKFFMIASMLLAFSLVPGVLGFHWVGGLDIKSALINSLSTLGSIDAPHVLKNDAGRVFMAFYGLFTETIFLLAMAILISPFIHRVYHKFHVHERRKHEQ